MLSLADKRLEIDFEWAIKLNRMSLKLMGLWPQAKQSNREKLLCNLLVSLVLLILICGILIPCTHALIKIHSDLLLMMDNLQFLLSVITCIIRIMIFWWKKEAIEPIINMIAKDWLKVKTVQERNIMIRTAHYARVVITFGYCSLGSVCVLVLTLSVFGISYRCVTNITDPGRPLPLQTYYIYDVTKHPQYELTFLSHSISMMFAVISYIGVDNFLGLVIFHICGQIEILVNRLTQLHKNSNLDVLKSNVTDHTRLLRAIAIVQDTYNIILLALFFYFGALFGCFGFLLITQLEEAENISIFRIIYLVILLMSIFVHMCFYCAFGELLMACCERIHYAAYNHAWYSMEPKDARNLIILMIRSNKPVCLIAGKIFPMTMATFCSLLKTSAGYISFLLTTRT